RDRVLEEVLVITELEAIVEAPPAAADDRLALAVHVPGEPQARRVVVVVLGRVLLVVAQAEGERQPVVEPPVVLEEDPEGFLGGNGGVEPALDPQGEEGREGREVLRVELLVRIEVELAVRGAEVAEGLVALRVLKAGLDLVLAVEVGEEVRESLV